VKAADKLSTWVGPVVEYATGADLIVLAALDDQHVLHVAALSGPPPLVSAVEADDLITLDAPRELLAHLPAGSVWGGIVINPATARRSRIAGQPATHDDGVRLTCPVAFTNCRKYILASRSTGDHTHVGPVHTAPCPFDDSWVAHTIANAEMAFLVSVTADGVADVSHRGGPPGFLRYDATTPRIAWTEYLGDGMFVSAGNLRANAQFALIVLDIESGDAVKLTGLARYTNVRTDRHERVDALLQANEPFPVQGSLEASVLRVERLTGLCLPRERVTARARITAADTTAVQHPQ
jgi:hypothetical protein